MIYDQPGNIQSHSKYPRTSSGRRCQCFLSNLSISTSDRNKNDNSKALAATPSIQQITFDSVSQWLGMNGTACLYICTLMIEILREGR